MGQFCRKFFIANFFSKKTGTWRERLGGGGGNLWPNVFPKPFKSNQSIYFVILAQLHTCEITSFTLICIKCSKSVFNLH